MFLDDTLFLRTKKEPPEQNSQPSEKKPTKADKIPKFYNKLKEADASV